MSNFFSKGFTLIEMLVVVGVMSLLILGMTSLFFATVKGGQKVDTYSKLRQDGNYALNFMKTKTRNANGINCGTAGQITLTSENPDLTFALQAGKIVAITASAVDLTSDNLTAFDLSFDCNTASVPPSVVISFSLEEPGISEKQDFQTTVSLRTY